MQIYDFNGEDFKIAMQFEGWKIGFLRYSDRFSKFRVLERHLETDEAFILLEGEAVLYEDILLENEAVLYREFAAHKMEKCKVYIIEKGKWHHITVSKDATVIVVENSNTSLNNTERKAVNIENE